MENFFKVKEINEVIALKSTFPLMGTEIVELFDSMGRVLAKDIYSDIDLPDFTRATMDGYAVCAASTFGATEGVPIYLKIKGSIAMGEAPSFAISLGEAAKISTGGMLPDGADSVIMIEHTDVLDDSTIEIYKSLAPGQNVIHFGEDFKKGDILLKRGRKIRPQEMGLLAAFGHTSVSVYKQPVIGIISTGDEIIKIEDKPCLGQLRDINTYTLLGQIKEIGAKALKFGIVKDNLDELLNIAKKTIEQCDMVLISGGSSVGMRDYTISALSMLSNSNILVHGVAISPGKPTILAKIENKAVWGLPGHVVSAMIVFKVVVKPFIDYISGLNSTEETKISAVLSRNIPSAQGRIDYIRVKLFKKDNMLLAEPVLGKSGLINTMVKADGLIEIPINVEGLKKESIVEVSLL
ncbi:MAG: molybdopterin molybdotransferase MoeA [Desulfobacterales bacterium]|nr:molybdopterin molybdotransferase MoeA [Desulfobacterales bacterium]MBF0395492.1 molybdopterin molybdotransferase MoeA [Desulfobacterales bacterium]